MPPLKPSSPILSDFSSHLSSTSPAWCLTWQGKTQVLPRAAEPRRAGGRHAPLLGAHIAHSLPGHPQYMLPSWVPALHALLPGTCCLHPPRAAQASTRAMPQGSAPQILQQKQKSKPHHPSMYRCQPLLAGSLPTRSHHLVRAAGA